MFYDNDDKIFFSDFAEEAFKNGESFQIVVDEKYNELVEYGDRFNANEFYSLVKNSDIKKLSLSKDDLITKFNEYSNQNEIFRITNIKYDRTGVSEMTLQYKQEESSDGSEPDQYGILR